MYLSDVLTVLGRIGIGIYVVASMFFVLGALHARKVKGKDEFWRWLTERNDRSTNMPILATIAVLAICAPMFLCLLLIKFYDDPNSLVRIHTEYREHKALRLSEERKAQAEVEKMNAISQQFIDYLRTRSEELKQLEEPCIGYQRVLSVAFQKDIREGDSEHCGDCEACGQNLAFLLEVEQGFLRKLQQSESK